MPYDGPAEEAARLASLASEMGNASVVRAIEILGQAIVDIRGQAVADPRLVLEVALVRITRREARTCEETLLDRIERLEARLASGAPLPPATAATSAPASAPERPAPKPGGPLLAARPRREAGGATRTAGPRARTGARDRDARSGAGRAAGAFTLDDVIEAWPEVLDALKPPVRATFQDAQPIGLEDGVIVFGAPKQRKDAINERFRKEADTIKEVFSTRLGSPPKFMLRAHDFGAHDALAPTTQPVGTDAAARSPEEHVDLEDLVDAPDAPPSDSVARLAAELGAEIVEERPRLNGASR